MTHRPQKKPSASSRIREAYLKNADGKKKTFPMDGYLVLLGLYVCLFGGLYAAARKKGKGIPERIEFRDLALLGAATHKFSRVFTRGLVTSPLRSPFTEYGESLGEAEIYEKSRGKGLFNAFGDLITCPWCFGSWVALGACFSFAVNPRFTRMAASVFAVEAASDFLHVGYDILKKLKG